MVARPSAGLYSPLQGSMDDGPQSGSEGSDLHSPGFSSYPPNDNYHHLIPQHTQFDYLPPVVGQQPPLIDAALEIPSPTSDEYSSGPFASSSRSHNHTQLHSSYIPSPVSPRLPNADYRYHSNSQSSERRLLSHDTNYHRPLPSVSINQDSRRVSGPLQASESPTASPTTTTSSHPPRREVSSVVIACRQCRGRKIRCDSTRPVCNNCVRRSNVCEYDSVPKRRGPDKKPGTRQRSCKKRPSEESDPVEVPPAKRKRSERRDAPVTEKVERVDDKVDPHRRYSNSSAGVYPQQHPHSSHSYSYSKTPSMLPVNHPKFPPPVSVDAEQRVWWDEFLQSYRLQDIRQELNTLFASAPQHLSFINIPFVLNKLADEPLNVQPSFVLAGLAMGLLMRSAAPSGSDTASDSLRRAMYLRNLAQSALEASYDSRWIDGTLAEAALILTLFEMSLHPEYSIQRIEKALLLLDEIIRHLALTSLDASDPEVTRFSQRSAPVVHLQSSSLSPVSPLAACVCTPADSLRPPDPYNTSVYQLPWDENWTEYEVRQEECRRLCWSALGMAAQYSIQCAVEERETVTSRMFICDPGNYAILFPGECIDRISPPYRAADAPSPKDSVWALYCRSMLLWSFCDNLKRRSYHQSGSAPQFEDKAEDAQEAWNEAQAIQDALEAHQCNLDTAVMWMCTEFIYNSRMAITQTFRRSVLAPDSVPTRPAFTPEQAEEWISFQGEIIKRASMSIRQYGVTGNPLARRPYQAPWFATQLQLCLRLWDSDPNLYSALRLGQEIMYLLNSINQLWPCRAHQLHCEELRKRLQAAQSFAASSSDGHLRRSIKF